MGSRTSSRMSSKVGSLSLPGSSLTYPPSVVEQDVFLLYISYNLGGCLIFRQFGSSPFGDFHVIDRDRVRAFSEEHLNRMRN